MSQEHTLPAVSDLLRALFKWLLELELESRHCHGHRLSAVSLASDLVATVTITDSKSNIESESVSKYAQAAQRLRATTPAGVDRSCRAAARGSRAAAGCRGWFENPRREMQGVLLYSALEDALYLLSFSVCTYSISSALFVLQNLQSQTLCFLLLCTNKNFLHRSWYQLRLSTK